MEKILKERINTLIAKKHKIGLAWAKCEDVKIAEHLVQEYTYLQSKINMYYA